MKSLNPVELLILGAAISIQTELIAKARARGRFYHSELDLVDTTDDVMGLAHMSDRDFGPSDLVSILGPDGKPVYCHVEAWS